MNYDDETLMAFVDGELDAARSADIAAAMSGDPLLASRVQQQRDLREKIAGAYAAVLDQPVPRRLVTAVQAPANVVPFPARNSAAPATPWRGREWGAMAASLFLGALISWKVFAPEQPALMTAHDGALVARGALASALDRQLASAQRGEEPVLIGLSFLSRDGQYCRSFLLREAGTAGLACQTGEAWQIAQTSDAPVPADGVRQAASPPASVLQAIEARIAGEALDAAGEENAQRAGWAPHP